MVPPIRSPKKLDTLKDKDDMLTRSKAKVRSCCDFCLLACPELSDSIQCIICTKHFHLSCASLTLNQKSYLADRCIEWLCQGCYFNKLASSTQSANKLALAIQQIDEGVTAFKKEIANYNLINDDHIDVLYQKCKTIEDTISTNNLICIENQTTANARIAALNLELQCMTDKFNNLENDVISLKENLKEVNECNYKATNNSLPLSLKAKLDHLDRLWVAQNLLLINVPVIKDENVSALVYKFCDLIGMPNPPVNSFNCYRVATKTKNSQHPAPILIKFNNINQRNEMFSSYLENLKGSHPPNALMMGLSSDPMRIYLNENLTSDAFKLFTRAREYKQQGCIFQTFTSYGSVFVRLKREGPKMRVNSIEHLDSICNINGNTKKQKTNEPIRSLRINTKSGNSTLHDDARTSSSSKFNVNFINTKNNNNISNTQQI